MENKAIDQDCLREFERGRQYERFHGGRKYAQGYNDAMERAAHHLSVVWSFDARQLEIFKKYMQSTQ